MNRLARSTAQFQEDWKAVEQAWTAAGESWQDRTHVQFELEFWHVIDAERRVYGMAVEVLLSVLNEARNSVN